MLYVQKIITVIQFNDLILLVHITQNILLTKYISQKYHQKINYTNNKGKLSKLVGRSPSAAEMMLQRRGTGLTQVFYITVRTSPLHHPVHPRKGCDPPLKMRRAFSITFLS